MKEDDETTASSLLSDRATGDRRPAFVAKCKSCGGERVLWLMSEFPVPCPECNPASPEYRAKVSNSK